MSGASSVWEQALTPSVMSSHSCRRTVGPTGRACGLRALVALSLQLCAHVSGETFHLAVVQVFSSLFSFYCDEIGCVITPTPSPATLMRQGCLPTVQWCVGEISA